MREVIHRIDEIGPACLDSRWATGRPRLLSDDDEDFVVQTATTARPAKLGQSFTRWSIRDLAPYLRRGIAYQHTKTWAGRGMASPTGPGDARSGTAVGPEGPAQFHRDRPQPACQPDAGATMPLGRATATVPLGQATVLLGEPNFEAMSAELGAGDPVVERWLAPQVNCGVPRGRLVWRVKRGCAFGRGWVCRAPQSG